MLLLEVPVLLPEALETVPEAAGMLPESSGLLPESSGLLPEASALLSEALGLLLEKAKTVPGKSFTLSGAAGFYRIYYTVYKCNYVMKDEENIFMSENFLITLFNYKNVQIFTISYHLKHALSQYYHTCALCYFYNSTYIGFHTSSC